jgi:hypothetical protein
MQRVPSHVQFVVAVLWRGKVAKAWIWIAECTVLHQCGHVLLRLDGDAVFGALWVSEWHNTTCVVAAGCATLFRVVLV